MSARLPTSIEPTMSPHELTEATRAREALRDYFGPLIYLNDEALFPISLGLTYFKQSSQDAGFGTQWNLMMAASFVAIVPVALLFFYAQRSFINSVMSSSLKQ